MRLRSRKNWNAWWDELSFLKSIPLYIIVDSWLPRPLLFHVGATSLAKPEISDLLSSTIVVNFLACWHYWILIRRVCDLSVGAASLQPEMRTTSSTTSKQFCLPIAQLVSKNQPGTSSRTTFKMRIGTSLAILFTNVGQLLSWSCGWVVKEPVLCG
jgi:hypothetical protein